MSLYDTRFFFEHYYAGDADDLRRTKDELSRKGPKYVSSVTVHELYKIVLEKEGRDVAKLRTGVLVKEFIVIAMDTELAVQSAEIRSKYRIPMADSVIAATALTNKLECLTDDPHLSQMRELKTRWLL